MSESPPTIKPGARSTEFILTNVFAGGNGLAVVAEAWLTGDLEFDKLSPSFLLVGAYAFYRYSLKMMDRWVEGRRAASAADIAAAAEAGAQAAIDRLRAEGKATKEPPT